jgi:N-acetylgalactosamine-6-sulfatase
MSGSMQRIAAIASSVGAVLAVLVIVGIFWAEKEERTQARLAAVAEKPNVVFILVDDLGWGDLGCYGNRQIRTPNLDRMAEEGTMFTQFYVNSSVCSPSRTAFLTGQYPARWGIHDYLSGPNLNKRRGMPNELDPTSPQIGRQLKQAGYVTGHFGKWHLGRVSCAEYGFDHFKTFVGPPPKWDEAATDPQFWAKSTDYFVDGAIRFIEANREKPFFVNVWTTLPHAPILPTDEQLDQYDHFRSRSPLFTSPWQIYYAAVTSVDKAIGRLLARLDDLELTDNTLVLFSSDNGPEDLAIDDSRHSGVGSPGPLRGRKRSLYDGGVRTPLIVRWPGHVSSGRIDTESVVSAVDFFPTLCEISGAPLPYEYEGDGEDVSDILRGQSRARRKPLMWEWRYRVFGHPFNRSPMLAIRDDQWKLLMNPDRSRIELYNMRSDPREMTNVAPHHAELVERLSKAVIAWQTTLPKGPIGAEAGKDDYPWPMAKPGNKR